MGNIVNTQNVSCPMLSEYTLLSKVLALDVSVCSLQEVLQQQLVSGMLVLLLSTAAVL